MKRAGVTYDARLAGQAAVLATAALVVALLLSAATDEGGVRWAVRLGRVLPAAPVCAALGTGLAWGRSRVRGEALVLEMLGRTHWRCVAPAVAGGVAVSLLSAAILCAAPDTALPSFFPRLEVSSAYLYANGLFVERGHGTAIRPDGSIVWVPPLPADSPAAMRPSRPAKSATAATATVVSALAFAMAAARLRRSTALGLALSVFLVIAASMIFFQAAAAGRVWVGFSVLPSLVLLVVLGFRYRVHPCRATTNA